MQKGELEFGATTRCALLGNAVLWGTMRRRRHRVSFRAAALAVAYAVAACGEATEERPSEDVVAPRPTSGQTGATRESQAAQPVDGGPGAAHSDTVAPAAPCTPPGSDTTTTPSPGRCEGDTAVTCDVATRTEKREACGADAVCTRFDLEEMKFAHDGSGWMPSRTIPWAACVPNDAEPCALSFANGWRPTATPYNQCAGDARVSCRVPNLPKYPDVTTDHWQLAIGGPAGFKIPTPCPAGETCRVALGIDETSCFPKAAAACTAATPRRCEAGGFTYCSSTYSYERVRTCSNGESCGAGCDGLLVCAPGGATQCDPATTGASCATPTILATCSSVSCRTESRDCSKVGVVMPGGKVTTVPGRCAVVAGEARCIRASAVVCDPHSFIERCDGSNAVRCSGGLEQATDCAATARECAIASGKAGCRDAQAPACGAQTPASCSGTALVSCCPASGVAAAGPYVAPCVPGYEYRFDCRSVNPQLTCILRGAVRPFAECATP